jgi:hypothetical protein
METFDEIVDFVVVGSGGGSMCAGLLDTEVEAIAQPAPLRKSLQ